MALLYLEDIKKHIKNNFLLFLVVSLAFIMNIAVAPEPFMALYTIVKLYEIYIVYIIFSDKKDRNQGGTVLKTAVYALLLGALFQSTLVTLQFINKGSLQGIFYYFGERFFTLSTPGITTASLNGQEILRPYGTFSHPNSLGGFYVLIYAFTLALLDRGDKEKTVRLPLLILGTVASFLIFLSFSKTAIGVFVMVTILSLCMQFFKRKDTCFPCLLSRALIPFILGLIFFQTKGDAYSIQKRLLLIQQTLVLFQKYPLLGVGFGNHLYFQAQFPTPYAAFFLQPVHNIFLLVLVQGGLVVTAFLGWISFQKINKKTFLAAVVVITTGLLDHYWLTLIQNMLLLGVVFGLLR